MQLGSSERESHTTMTMLSVEEEEEWGRSCDSGDIRVGFETEANSGEWEGKVYSVWLTCGCG